MNDFIQNSPEVNSEKGEPLCEKECLLQEESLQNSSTEQAQKRTFDQLESGACDSECFNDKADVGEQNRAIGSLFGVEIVNGEGTPLSEKLPRDAYELLQPTFEKKKKKRTANDLLSTLLTVFLAILCVSLFFVKFVWFYCVEVDGDSMNATLTSGDYLLVDKLASVERGDVVVFTLEEKAYIKRVVAVEGDTVMMKNGDLYVKKAGEEYFELTIYEGVIGNTYYTIHPTQSEYTYTVPQNCVYVLGDNRENSTDSRRLGAINNDLIDGVVHQFFIDKKDGALGKIYRFI